MIVILFRGFIECMKAWFCYPFLCHHVFMRRSYNGSMPTIQSVAMVRFHSARSELMNAKMNTGMIALATDAKC